MTINFSKLKSSATQMLIEPRDVFMALPNKDKKYGYPRDVQTEVWKRWYENREKKNNIIKMNTGSGKTVVGLTILQSCLNEGKGPAVYVVPDNYLVAQVCTEAEKLGIKVAYDKYDSNYNLLEKGEDDYFFKTKKAILVTNIFKVVNGKSIFGLRSSGNVPIGSIIIDDVHACLDTITQQCTVRVNADHPIYEQIMQVFEQSKELEDDEGFYDVRTLQDSRKNKLIPFWIWQKHCEEIRRLLKRTEYEKENFVLFNLPLLESNWKTCNCVISSKEIEITPKSIPISKITSFEQADRRIFMSATISDDSVFVAVMGLSSEDISYIITPEKANDIGERLILFPKHLNAQIGDSNVKEKLQEVALEHNVVVIVPSFERLNFWLDPDPVIPVQILSSREKNIDAGITALKNGTFRGLTILVNKYDGVDLPDDSCRFLVIDGLPVMKNQYDSIIQGMTPNNQRICREQIQKIEQGMGRGVRSNSDYCVVILMGDKLADVIVNQNGGRFFGTATLEQYRLSQELWEQLLDQNPKPSVQEVFSLADFIMSRNPEWISASKSRLASIEYDSTVNIDSTVVAMRKAFDKETIDRFDEACSIIETEKNSNQHLDNNEKGFLMQLMAEYRNFTNPANAQEILLSAQQLNNKLLRPISGINYKKLHSFSDGQGANALKYFEEYKNFPNNYLIRVGAIVDDLRFMENSSDSFEESIHCMAQVLGIHASRPEKEGEPGGPDNLWALGELMYFVIECKNGVKEDISSISKKDCAQLLSSIQWFQNKYTGNEFRCFPIMIHRVNKFDDAASPDPRIRIITHDKLEKLKTALLDFAKGLTNITEVNRVQATHNLLAFYKLNGQAFIDTFTVSFR